MVMCSGVPVNLRSNDGQPERELRSAEQTAAGNFTGPRYTVFNKGFYVGGWGHLDCYRTLMSDLTHTHAHCNLISFMNCRLDDF